MNAACDHGGIESAERVTENQTFDAPRCTVRGGLSHSFSSVFSHGRCPKQLTMPRRASRENDPSIVLSRPHSHTRLIARSDAVILVNTGGLGSPNRCVVEPVLRAGRPVLVDKFLAPSSADALAMLQTAQAHNVLLASSSLLYYAPRTVAVLRSLNDAPIDRFPNQARIVVEKSDRLK